MSYEGPDVSYLEYGANSLNRINTVLDRRTPDDRHLRKYSRPSVDCAVAFVAAAAAAVDGGDAVVVGSIVMVVAESDWNRTDSVVGDDSERSMDAVTSSTRMNDEDSVRWVRVVDDSHWIACLNENASQILEKHCRSTCRSHQTCCSCSTSCHRLLSCSERISA